MEVEHRAQDDGEEVMETEAATSGEVAEVEMETEGSEAMDSPTSGPGSDVSSCSC